MTTFAITPEGAFSLESAANFGFGPNSGRPVVGAGGMRLAFVTDDLGSQAFVDLTQDADGTVRGEVQSDAQTDVVRAQVARILSLDHSGTEWAAVGDRDAVLGSLQLAHPGLRPVLFHSPYEAAAWSIISARRYRAQGTVVRNRLATELGRVYSTGTEQLFAFPTPERLLELRQLQGLDETRVERLHVVARAALDGLLDPAALRELPTDEAMERLMKLPGIGPMYGTLILLRSTGLADGVTGAEPRLAGYLGHFYELGGPATPEQITGIIDAWRPFRTWGSVLVRVAGDRLGLPVPPNAAFANRRRG